MLPSNLVEHIEQHVGANGKSRVVGIIVGEGSLLLFERLLHLVYVIGDASERCRRVGERQQIVEIGRAMG